MTNLVVKVAFLMFLLQNDGSVKSMVNIVEECPPEQVVYRMMEEKLREREIKGWAAACQSIIFEVEPEIQS
jgi:radical SAM superfamily enzyme